MVITVPSAEDYRRMFDLRPGFKFSRFRINRKMLSNVVEDHLARTFGYEIAAILTDTELRRDELKEAIPYKDPHDERIERILIPGIEEGIFERALTRKYRKYTLNSDRFSEEDLDEIERRAKARLFDSNEEVQSRKLPDAPPENLNHMNAANVQSKFYR
ncbi:hypothetical protein [Halosimplex pelagicum]|uniref:Uncharacterized protein n=1 Tax=Halosimplex pelagicum TaxID=869886 RepID=A0A7D5TDJ9_9EURY|nr:hypothetical protein [Halosimplex pelagicum]QLH83849.1 hypothetical protein HZS54_20420 [Halosimplex pelagicum]